MRLPSDVTLSHTSGEDREASLSFGYFTTKDIGKTIRNLDGTGIALVKTVNDTSYRSDIRYSYTDGEIEILLENANWSTGDIGKELKNMVDGQTGKAVITGIKDMAPQTGLTLSAVTGEVVTFTLESGEWTDLDIGRTIENHTINEFGVKETGRAIITSISGNEATAKVVEKFTDNDVALEKGEWKLRGNIATATVEHALPIEELRIPGAPNIDATISYIR